MVTIKLLRWIITITINLITLRPRSQQVDIIIALQFKLEILR